MIGVLSILFELDWLISTRRLYEVDPFIIARFFISTRYVAASWGLLPKIRQYRCLRQLTCIDGHRNAYTARAGLEPTGVALLGDRQVSPLHHAIMPILFHCLHLPFESIQKVRRRSHVSDVPSFATRVLARLLLRERDVGLAPFGRIVEIVAAWYLLAVPLVRIVDQVFTTLVVFDLGQTAIACFILIVLSATN